MAIAPTYAGNAVQGNLNEVIGAQRLFAVTATIGAADTYVTGGFAVTPATFGLTKINWMGPMIFSTGHWGLYVPSTGKIGVFSGAGAELANASAVLQNATVTIFGMGK